VLRRRFLLHVNPVISRDQSRFWRRLGRRNRRRRRDADRPRYRHAAPHTRRQTVAAAAGLLSHERRPQGALMFTRQRTVANVWDIRTCVIGETQNALSIAVARAARCAIKAALLDLHANEWRTFWDVLGRALVRSPNLC